MTRVDYTAEKITGIDKQKGDIEVSEDGTTSYQALYEVEKKNVSISFNGSHFTDGVVLFKTDENIFFIYKDDNTIHLDNINLNTGMLLDSEQTIGLKFGLQSAVTWIKVCKVLRKN